MADLPGHNIAESIGHEDRGTTIIEVYSIYGRDESEEFSLVEFIERLQAVLAKIPEEHRASATFQIYGHGEYVSVGANATYRRPETDAELADRRRWLKSIDDEREARDRHEFARLSQKYSD